MSLCRRLIAHGGTHGKAILYMLSMRPSGEKHVDVDFLNFSSLYFTGRTPIKRCPVGFHFFISKAWVVIWYNYYYYSRMRKTHNFWLSPDIVHGVQMFKLFTFNLRPVKRRRKLPFRYDCRSYRPHLKQWCWAAFFVPWIEKSLTPARAWGI